MSRTLSFTKMNGAGNDFVLVDNRAHDLALTREAIARLCDRHRGIGADGLLAVEPAAHGADFRMRYYNADGGEAEMCGNGARCFARFVNSLHNFRFQRTSFETLAGDISAEFLGDHVRIEMSAPHSISLHEKLSTSAGELTAHSINTGVPHVVVVVDELEAVEIRATGASLRYHERFQPKGTNANFLQLISSGKIAIRTYERGVEDETLACGTGTVAAALVHHLLQDAPSPISVKVRGGDTLLIGFEKSSPDTFEKVTLTGPADFVFIGSIGL